MRRIAGVFKLKKRTALLQKLKAVFRRYQSQPVDRVVQLINPILSGWVNHFALGDAGECFTFIQDWVEKKVRRHMMRARNRKGFGWTRWSTQWLYTTLRLFNRYRVYRPTRKAALFWRVRPSALPMQNFSCFPFGSGGIFLPPDQRCDRPQA